MPGATSEEHAMAACAEARFELSLTWLLRIAAAMCFIGHGAFGILTKGRLGPVVRGGRDRRGICVAPDAAGGHDGYRSRHPRIGRAPPGGVGVDDRMGGVDGSVSPLCHRLGAAGPSRPRSLAPREPAQSVGWWRSRRPRAQRRLPRPRDPGLLRRKQHHVPLPRDRFAGVQRRRHHARTRRQ